MTRAMQIESWLQSDPSHNDRNDLKPIDQAKFEYITFYSQNQ